MRTSLRVAGTRIVSAPASSGARGLVDLNPRAEIRHAVRQNAATVSVPLRLAAACAKSRGAAFDEAPPNGTR